MVSVAFGGKPVELLGKSVHVGDTAPDFTVLDREWNEKKLNDYSGVRILASVPSLDTGVCDAETRRFNEEATRLDGVTVITVSVDLPFAQSRWCGAAGLDDAVTLSDHRDLSFGKAYGAVMKGFRLLARAVFVVDSSDRVVYTEYVDEVTHHPDYTAAIEAAKNA
ncbi:thiol peroxidase [Sporolactobacillus sp. THM7-7]|nr:thiol peroxidase [Sporolactobacillus sp. THM7-7]